MVLEELQGRKVAWAETTVECLDGIIDQTAIFEHARSVRDVACNVVEEYFAAPSAAIFTMGHTEMKVSGRT